MQKQQSVCWFFTTSVQRHLSLWLAILLAGILAGGYVFAGDDALYVDQNGNVGIGTSDPKAKLDVDGDIITRKHGGTLAGVKWTSVKKEKVCDLPLSGEKEQSYPLPGVIPESAAEAFLYVWIRTGNIGSEDQEGDIEFEIYSQEKQEKEETFSVYFYAHKYPQGAYSYNSDNFWLPQTTERKIHIKRVKGQVKEHSAGELFVIGYR